MPVKVHIGRRDLRGAAMVGVDRRIQALTLGCKDKHGYQGRNPWQIDVEGALAEKAAAVALEIEFEGKLNNFKVGGDLGGYIQVRHSEGWNNRLLVRTGDRSSDVFVFVVGKAPNYLVVGWITGSEAKRVGSWEDPDKRGGAWFVSQEDLRPIEVLRNHIRQHGLTRRRIPE